MIGFAGAFLGRRGRHFPNEAETHFLMKTTQKAKSAQFIVFLGVQGDTPHLYPLIVVIHIPLFPLLMGYHCFQTRIK